MFTSLFLPSILTFRILQLLDHRIACDGCRRTSVYAVRHRATYTFLEEEINRTYCGSGK